MLAVYDGLVHLHYRRSISREIKKDTTEINDKADTILNDTEYLAEGMNRIENRLESGIQELRVQITNTGVPTNTENGQVVTVRRESLVKARKQQPNVQVQEFCSEEELKEATSRYSPKFAVQTP